MKTILFVLVVLGVAFLMVRTPRSSAGSGEELHQTNDGDVIAQLRSAGSDLSRPHSVDFFFYFSSQAAADRVSEKLAGQGYNTSVERTQDGTQWQVLAKKQLIPTERILQQIRHDFSAIAAAEGGEYDGWGAAVVR